MKKITLQEYLHTLVTARVMMEVVYTIVIQSLDKKDYEENKDEIVDQITGQILYERDTK